MKPRPSWSFPKWDPTQVGQKNLFSLKNSHTKLYWKIWPGFSRNLRFGDWIEFRAGSGKEKPGKSLKIIENQ